MQGRFEMRFNFPQVFCIPTAQRATRFPGNPPQKKPGFSPWKKSPRNKTHLGLFTVKGSSALSEANCSRLLGRFSPYLFGAQERTVATQDYYDIFSRGGPYYNLYFPLVRVVNIHKFYNFKCHLDSNVKLFSRKSFQAPTNQQLLGSYIGWDPRYHSFLSVK